jgi:hypothetical protein
MTDEEWVANMPDHHLKGYEQYPHHDNTLVAIEIEGEDNITQAQIDELEKLEKEADRQGSQSLAQMNTLDDLINEDVDNDFDDDDEDALNNEAEEDLFDDGEESGDEEDPVPAEPVKPQAKVQKHNHNEPA